MLRTLCSLLTSENCSRTELMADSLPLSSIGKLLTFECRQSSSVNWSLRMKGQTELHAEGLVYVILRCDQHLRSRIRYLFSKDFTENMSPRLKSMDKTKQSTWRTIGQPGSKRALKYGKASKSNMIQNGGSIFLQTAPSISEPP